MSGSDSQLLALWRIERSADAFSELILRYAGMVYATSLRILQNAHDAEEVAQDCFIALAQSTAEIDVSMGPWLHRVATRRALDRRKSEVRRQMRHERIPAGEPPEQCIEFNELLEHVDAAIAELPDRLRFPVVEHFLNARPQHRIASDLGITQQAVSHRIKMGIDAIRDTLQKRGIAVSVALLGTFLSENAKATVPQALSVSLSKLALAGVRQTIAAGQASAFSAGAAKAAVGGIVVKKSIAVATGVVVIAALGWYAWRQGKDSKMPAPARVDTSVAAPTLVAGPEKQPAGPMAAAPIPQQALAADAPLLEPGEIAQPEDYASVSGRIADEEGRPVAGAAVGITAFGAENRQLRLPLSMTAADLDRIFGNGRHLDNATSNTDGRYEISGIRFAGPALVAVNAPRYDVINKHAGRITIAPASHHENLDFTLVPGRTLYGIVLNPAGQPLGNADVICPNAGAIMSTGVDGTFAMNWPTEQEKLTFYVFHERFGRTSFIDMLPRADQVLELRLTQKGAVRGSVAYSDGSPAAGHTVLLSGRGAEDDADDPRQLPPYAAAVEVGGVYEAPSIEPGFYRATVVDPSGAPASGVDDLGYIRPGETRTWDYTLADAMTVRGTVRAESTRRPMPNQAVAWVKDGKVAATAQSDAEGRFRIEATQGGAENLVAPMMTEPGSNNSLPEWSFLYAKRIAFVPGGEFQVDFMLPDKFSAVAYFVDESGAAVVDGIEVEAAILDPKTANMTRSSPLSPNANGGYSWDEFVPGMQGYFHAWPRKNSPYIYARTPTFNGPAASGIVEVVARLYGKGTIEGRLITHDGSVISNEEYWWCNLELDDGQTYGPISDPTNENGYFSCDVPAAGFHMTVSCADENQRVWQWRSGPLRVQPGHPLELGDVRLEALATVE